MATTQKEIAAKIASLVRERNAINQKIHYWRSRQKPNKEPNTKPNTNLTRSRSLSPLEKERTKEKDYTPFSFSFREGGEGGVFLSDGCALAASDPAAMEKLVWDYATKANPLDRASVAEWLDEAKANQWRFPNGTPITHGNFRAPLRGFVRTHLKRESDATHTADAQSARLAKQRESAVAALMERDWELCAESCANCTGRSCSKNHALPCGHRMNTRPVPPSDCPHFTAKGGAA